MDQTPDSWDQVPQSAEKLSGLSISAKPFVPNVNALEFVPNFGGGGGNMVSPSVEPVQSWSSVANPNTSSASNDENVKDSLESGPIADEMNPGNGECLYIASYIP